MSVRSALASRHRLRRVRYAAVVAVVCVACGAGGMALAAPASAGPAGRAASPTTGGLDPDTQQHATAMAPAGAADPQRSAHALTASAATRLQAYAASDLQGIDVASYQHPNGAAINWSAVRAAGYSFAFVKASESTGYANPYYAQDVKAARAAGLQVGAYHFARPAYSAVAQADKMASVMKTAPGSLPPVLDLEDNGDLSVAALQTWVGQFMSRLHADTGVVPTIYTGPGFWSSSMGGTDGFTGYPLWVAHYTTSAAPDAVGGWANWSFWQWSDGSFDSPAAVPGISGDVDRDRFSGNATALEAYAMGGLGFTGAAVRTVTYGQTVSLSGFGPAGGETDVWFHKSGVAGYTDRRQLTGNPASGAWTTSYVANDDYRLYATAGGDTSNAILVQVRVTMANAAAATVPFGSTFTISGTGIPGEVVSLHFHKQGTPAADYSIVRTVEVGSTGTWVRAVVATCDYRFFATAPNGTSTGTALVQAR